jgi:outer membrane protein with glycine zipper
MTARLRIGILVLAVVLVATDAGAFGLFSAFRLGHEMRERQEMQAYPQNQAQASMPQNETPVSPSTNAGLARGVFVYPARGQSPSEQSRDEYQCHSWAVQQTGFNPTARTANAPPPSFQAPEGGLMRGALAGGAIGAAGGAIGGNAGEGAAIGAATLGLFGAFRRHAQEMQEQQKMQAYEQSQTQASMRQNEARASYDRAYKACLTGRGYSVD